MQKFNWLLKKLSKYSANYRKYGVWLRSDPYDAEPISTIFGREALQDDQLDAERQLNYTILFLSLDT